MGMLVVETIAKIRRAYFAQNKPIKTICREFRVSRRVARKVIRSQATEFRYERSRQPLPRIDPWRDQLDSLLLENEGKPARERLTLIRIFEELRALGYEGSYDAVRRYARVWRQARGSATVAAQRWSGPDTWFRLPAPPPRRRALRRRPGPDLAADSAPSRTEPRPGSWRRTPPRPLPM